MNEKPVNPLRHCVSPETSEIVDQIMGPFLESNLGKNDMAITGGLLASAAIMLATHCQITGDDFEEMAIHLRTMFDLALSVAGEQVKRSPSRPTVSVKPFGPSR